MPGMAGTGRELLVSFHDIDQAAIVRDTINRGHLHLQAEFCSGSEVIEVSSSSTIAARTSLQKLIL